DTVLDIPHLHPIEFEDHLNPTYPTPFVHIVRWSKFWVVFRLPTVARLTRGASLRSSHSGFSVPSVLTSPLSTIVSRASLGSDGLMLYVMIMIVCVMTVSAVSMHVLALKYYRNWIDFLNDWMYFERRFPTLTVGAHSCRVALPLFIGFLLYIAFFVVNVLNELRFNLINNDGVGRMMSLVYVFIIYSFTLSMPVLWVVMASKVFSLCLCHIRRELESIIECVQFGLQCTSSPIQKCIATGDMNRMQEAVLGAG
ncbi:hypothetical protein Pcinc_029919, partial [Petrolisthes cinctipes]